MKRRVHGGGQIPAGPDVSGTAPGNLPAPRLARAAAEAAKPRHPGGATHPKLLAQLRALELGYAAPPATPAQWREFLEVVDRGYAEADRPVRERRYQDLFENAIDIIYTLDLDGRFTSLNRAAELLTGYDRAELIGQHFSKVLPPEQIPIAQEMLARKLRGEALSTRFEVEVIAKSGARIPVELSTRIVFDGGVAVEIEGLGRDVAARQTQERRLRHMATHDGLTGLPNRSVLETALRESLAATPSAGSSGRAGEAGELQVLMFLDLDNFKLVNDSLGHAAGDEVLKSIADLLSGIARAEDLVVRLGGDEFAVLLSCRNASDASAIAESFREAIEQADIRAADERFYVGASIGVTVVTTKDDDPSQLLSRADAAMYRAKERGRNRVVWADTGDPESPGLAPATQLATEIRAALLGRQFEVHYQPVLRLADGSVGHHEALVRMRSSSGALVAPGDFIPTAEHFGLIGQVDRLVIDTVLRELIESSRRRIFVNLSGITMADAELLDHIENQLRKHPSVGPRLGFEIAETAVVRDLSAAGSWMEKLTAVGCAFSLDDFGTGLSSLTYIRTLPVTQIKLDGSFTRSLHADSKQRAVVSTVQALADVLSIETVAECIENATTLRMVTEMGITFGQGFFLGRPVERLQPSSTRAA